MGNWAVHNFMHGILTHDFLGQKCNIQAWQFYVHAWKFPFSCMTFSCHRFFIHETFRTGMPLIPELALFEEAEDALTSSLEIVQTHMPFHTDPVFVYNKDKHYSIGHKIKQIIF